MKVLFPILMAAVGGLTAGAGVRPRKGEAVVTGRGLWVCVSLLSALVVAALVLSMALTDRRHFTDWVGGGTFLVLTATLAVVVVYTVYTGRLVEAGERRLQNEYRSLLFVMYGDSVLAFERCSILYEEYKPQLPGQRKEEGGEKRPSHSSLPRFPATCDLKRFAAICQDAEALVAVAHLNWRYFQIEPHIERAADLQMQWDAYTSRRSSLYQQELTRLRPQLEQNWKTGLRFLASYCYDLGKDTVLLRKKVLKEDWSEEEIEEFEDKFKSAEERTSDIHEVFPGTGRDT